MDVEVSFTSRSAREAERMLRKWYAWPLFLIRSIYGLAVIAALLFAGGSLFIRSLFSARIQVSGAILGLLMVLGPCAGYWWLRTREVRKVTAMLAAINPLRLTFDTNGVHTLEKNRASNFSPWSTFSGFREGRTIFLLREAQSGQHRVISKDGLSRTLSEDIKSVLASHLPEIK